MATMDLDTRAALERLLAGAQGDTAKAATSPTCCWPGTTPARMAAST